MERTEEIERLAYFLWLNAGQPAGTAEKDWLFAQHVVETGSVSAPDWSYASRAGPLETVSDPHDVERMDHGSS
jgi:hypothetical protein